jgi:tripartite-type tricarboxylate transporter receptor subunit TctC
MKSWCPDRNEGAAVNVPFLTRRLCAASFVLAWLPVTALAQPRSPDGYPRKPVRVLVGSPAGSGSDVMMRAIAVKLTDQWGQSVVVDNRAGATGAISIQLTAQAVPDGYTLATLSAQNVAAMALKTVTTDIPRELAPVVLMITQPYLLVVTPGLPVGSVKELIAYAKGKPLVFASSGTGSVVHLGMELFKYMAGVDMTHVPYKGSGQSMVDVMSGRVQLAITNTLTATPLVRNGRLRALAVTSAQRVPAFPDLPTIAEAGVPGYELGSWYGLIAPARTPPALVLLLNREIGQLMNSPEVKGKLSADGAEAAPANTPAQFRNVIVNEVAKWEKVVKALDIKG